MNQPVPFENTGMALEPPPTAAALKVVELASVTKLRAPAPTVEAEGSEATVVVNGKRTTLLLLLPIVISLETVALDAVAL